MRLVYVDTNITCVQCCGKLYINNQKIRTMVRNCIICKKERTRFESRSFHRFPTNEESKKKWMNATGLKSVSKSAVICCDHFDSNSFNDIGGLYGPSHKRRLLPHAVPNSKILQVSSVLPEVYDNLCMSTSSNHDTKSSNNITVNKSITSSNDTPDIKTESIDHPDGIIINEVLDEDIETSAKVKNTSRTCGRDISSGDDNSKKKIRFRTGFVTEIFSRRDCISDESWERFLRFNKCRSKQLQNAHSRTSRKRKTAANMKSLNRDLKKQKKKKLAAELSDQELK